jgi:hypothetical protein
MKVAIDNISKKSLQEYCLHYLERAVPLNLGSVIEYDGYRFTMDANGMFTLVNMTNSRLKQFIKHKMIFIPSVFDYLDKELFSETFGDMDSYCNSYSLVADGILCLPDYFCDGTNLKYVSLKSCKVLGEGAFSYCKELYEINVPNIERIEERCFFDCFKLEKINLSTVKFIGVHAFKGCSNLYVTNIEFPHLEFLGSEAFIGSSIQIMIAPELKKIPHRAFYESSLIYFLGLKVTSIGESAFALSQLRNINVPNASVLKEDCFFKTEISEFISYAEITSLETPFNSCPYLKVIELNGLVYLNGIIAVHCPNLEAVRLSSCIALHTAIFQACKSLRNIYLPALQKLPFTVFEVRKYTKLFVNKNVVLDTNGHLNDSYYINKMAMIHYID